MKIIQFRRGTTDENNAFTGAEGEITVDTTTKTLVVHDGSTAGGSRLAKEVHTHSSSDITNLQSALSSKADSGHTHVITDITNLQSTLDGKAASSHTHAIADITNLQSTLDGKAESSHTHSYLPLSGGTVSGNLTVTGTTNSGTFIATSDVRLKSDIEKIAMDLSSLSVYRYRLNSDGKVHVGLIAQEVEKVIPEAVSEGEDGWKSLDYNAVVAALVGEVNSLKARISELEKRQ